MQEEILLIAKALLDYGPSLDENRKTKDSLSTYKVEKPWGHEIWLELNEHYALKLIHMKAGNKSSLQSHVAKVESNYVLEGEANLMIQTEDGKIVERTISAGDGWTVLPNRKHRVIAHKDYTAIEVSTPHLDDVVRYEDDSNRPDGKIEDEHK